ncbi:response regulator [Oceanospirillum beijerinckii]|uniref:response regulator n=1 Tax=Oceanospirillum beijerinckii TaxID=64976 RepID=UPI00041E2A0C|nr:response regulator [Oceanospirillum beijerinckii]
MTDTAVYRIVIAEDDRRIAELQQRFVEKIDGFQVEAIALTLEEARDLVEVLEPDLLLLDIHFPEGTGLELLSELRGSNQATDVILVTAAKEASTLQAALRGGVFDYILKPLVFDRLQAALQNYARHRQQMDQLLQQEQAEQHLAQQDVDQLLPRGNTLGSSADSLLSRASGEHSSLDQSGQANTAEKAKGAQEKVVLPKGIDGLTLEKIRQAFQSSREDFNAEEVGEKVGVSRTTARRYLEYLVSTEELIADVNYGTVGRPERRYSLKA